MAVMPFQSPRTTSLPASTSHVAASDRAVLSWPGRLANQVPILPKKSSTACQASENAPAMARPIAPQSSDLSQFETSASGCTSSSSGLSVSVSAHASSSISGTMALFAKNVMSSVVSCRRGSMIGISASSSAPSTSASGVNATTMSTTGGRSCRIAGSSAICAFTTASMIGASAARIGERMRPSAVTS